MKKFFSLQFILLALALVFAGQIQEGLRDFITSRQERGLRNRALKLVGERGSCSGEQVEAPSGEQYVLTAAHCAPLTDKSGAISIITEDGRKLPRKIIAEDPDSDLLLLEGVPGIKGLRIAKELKVGEHVRTFTHGGGLDTWKSEGEVIQDMKIQFILFAIQTKDDADKCASAPKYKVEELDLFFFKVQVCTVATDETLTTARIIPGSSGGMMVNNSGQLVGVVSAGSDAINAFVRLQDIQNFLHNF